MINGRRIATVAGAAEEYSISGNPFSKGVLSVVTASQSSIQNIASNHPKE